MSEYESVSELVSKTGASYNEAKYAYEACGGDMLAAVIMLEKARDIKTEKPFEENAAADGVSDSRAAYRKIRRAQRAAGREAKKALGNACSKRIKVWGKREYFDIPLLAFIILFALAWNFSLPAFIISIICGVNYTLYGEGAENINIAFGRNRQNTAESSSGSAQPGGFTSPPQYRQYGASGQRTNPPNGSVRNATEQNTQNPMPQGQSVQIPRPVRNERPMEYAGSNPLDSEDKGFFN